MIVGETITTVKTVLVVEDEPIIRMAAIDLVEELGFTALEAASADEAIAILEANTGIHVIFTDIQMAGSMDGLDLAAYARNRWPPVEFIIVSGEMRPEAVHMPDSARFFPKLTIERRSKRL
jgi:two-component system, response regulator PdtaR